MSDLSDDLLVEIILHVPYQSTCCCKGVSRRWRDLLSHPDHRKKLPRSTLAGPSIWWNERVDDRVNTHTPAQSYVTPQTCQDSCTHKWTRIHMCGWDAGSGFFLTHWARNVYLSHPSILDVKPTCSWSHTCMSTAISPILKSWHKVHKPSVGYFTIFASKINMSP